MKRIMLIGLIMVFAFNRSVFADSIPSNNVDIFQSCDDIAKLKPLAPSKYDKGIVNIFEEAEILCLQLTKDKTIPSLLDFGLSSVIEAIELVKLTGKWDQEKIKKADCLIKNYNDTTIIVAKLQKTLGNLITSIAEFEDKLKSKKSKNSIVK